MAVPLLELMAVPLLELMAVPMMTASTGESCMVMTDNIVKATLPVGTWVLSLACRSS
jgi:hypothetical protein